MYGVQWINASGCFSVLSMGCQWAVSPCELRADCWISKNFKLAACFPVLHASLHVRTSTFIGDMPSLFCCSVFMHYFMAHLTAFVCLFLYPTPCPFFTLAKAPSAGIICIKRAEYSCSASERVFLIMLEQQRDLCGLVCVALTLMFSW